MTSRIIKDFSAWRLFEAAEPQDPAALYRAGDRAGLMALATVNDSAALKAKPGYAAIIKWWTDGHGDLSFWKSLVKSGDEKKADSKQSLDSAYYWAGSGSNANRATLYNTFIKALDATITAKPKVDAWIAKQNAANQARYSTAWIDGLGDIKSKLDAEKARGFIIIKSGMDRVFPAMFSDNMMDNKEYSTLVATDPVPDQVLRMLAQFKPLEATDTVIANKETYFRASISLSETDKLAILDSFAAKAKIWADKQNAKKPGSETIESAIAKATDLYIGPQNVKIEISKPAAPAAPQTVTASFSYPENPNGDEASEAFKKGLQMFPDDGTTIGATAAAELKTSVNDAVSKIQAAGGTITGVKTFAYSSTSKVPTKYGSADNTWNPDNNVKLANDRLAAINAALAAAISESGVQVAPTVDAENNTAFPNQGPDWGNTQRNDVAKYGKPGARTQAYQDEYGKWRFASAFFVFTYTITKTDSTPVAPQATPSGNWKSVIYWADESITIRIPKISLGSSYSYTPKPKNTTRGGVACPKF